MRTNCCPILERPATGTDRLFPVGIRQAFANLSVPAAPMSQVRTLSRRETHSNILQAGGYIGIAFHVQSLWHLEFCSLRLSVSASKIPYAA
jgi:hypothetical protein